MYFKTSDDFKGLLMILKYKKIEIIKN